jgi:hypothetical protein
MINDVSKTIFQRQYFQDVHCGLNIQFLGLERLLMISKLSFSSFNEVALHLMYSIIDHFTGLVVHKFLSIEEYVILFGKFYEH